MRAEEGGAGLSSADKKKVSKSKLGQCETVKNLKNVYTNVQMVSPHEHVLQISVSNFLL